MAKRARVFSGSVSPKKRGKQVGAQADVLLSVLKDSDCDVPGLSSNRKMLQNSVRYALAPASDERHTYQDSVVGYVGEITTAFVAKWQKRVDEAQAKATAAEGEKASAEAALKDAEGAVEAQENAIKAAKEQLHTDESAEQTAKKTLKEAEVAVKDHDSEQAAKVVEKDEHTSVVKDHFGALTATEPPKNEAGEPVEMTAKDRKTHVSKTVQLIKKLKADPSLMNAAPISLAKLPAERGDFDTLVLSQMEKLMQSNLQSLQQEVDSGESVKSQKGAALEAAKAALEAAKTKKTSSIEALKAAKEALKPLEDAEKAAKKFLKEKESVLKTENGELSTQQGGLEGAKAGASAFTFLKERVAAPPAPAAAPEPAA